MPQTLADYPQLHLARRSEVAYVNRRGFRTLRWTYRQLAELAFRFARELEARGIGKGDRVLLWGDLSLDYAPWCVLQNQIQPQARTSYSFKGK